MQGGKNNLARQAHTFLGALRRDIRGNTLMLIAAAIFPLIGIIGGSIDLGRMYLVKTRMQLACDAGALAGRKQMGGGAWTTGTRSSDSVAKELYDGNFPSGAYGTVSTTRTFSETSGVVVGSASSTVPMTLMAVLSAPQQTLTVNCHAQEQVPNTDVMFVLDNTESMSELPDGSGHLSAGSGTPSASSKIVNLKADVKCFFEALSKLDTGEASCDPIGGVTTSSRLRFGLVPYSTAVNIKQLNLPDGYFAQSWDYQSRAWSAAVSKWVYDKQTFAFPGFNSATTTITLPLGTSGANKNFTWDGCSEENAPITNVNAVPGTDPKSLYAPTIPAAVYYRNQVPRSDNLVDGSLLQVASVTTATELYSPSVGHYYYNCPAAAYGLVQYGPSATAVSTFVSRVDAMTYGGNTRHDIGMLWAGRLISPHGMFAANNTTTPNGGKLYRHIVFMTDGDAKANECDYATYGVPGIDAREVPTGTAVTKTTCATIGANDGLTTGVYNRLSALCTAVKSEPNTLLWVISFGSNDAKISADAKLKLANCATDGNHFFDATDNASLKLAFKQIASQISQLRLTQ